MTDDERPWGNVLLARLEPDDAARLRRDLEAVTIERRQVLERRRTAIEHVYFPSSGIASTVAEQGGDTSIEVGLFGRDGMSGQGVVMGDGTAIHQCFIQVEGEGHRIEAGALGRAMADRPGIRETFLRFFYANTSQMGHTAVANARARLEMRLARWLLMCHDRVEGDALDLTHEFLSVMLGVRRPGVTLGLNALQDEGLLDIRRGQIAIVDRLGLEAAAGRSYGRPEADYERLFGVSPRRR